MNNKYKLQVDRSGDNTITVLEHIEDNKYKIHWTVTSKHDSEPVYFLKFYTLTRFIYMNWNGTTKIYDVDTKEELFNQYYGNSLTSKAMLSDDNKTLYIRTKAAKENCLIAINLETFEEIKRIQLPYDKFRYIRFCDRVNKRFYFYQNELKRREFTNMYNVVDFETEEITTYELPHPQKAKNEPIAPILNLKNRKGVMPCWDKIEIIDKEDGKRYFVFKLMVFDMDTFEVEKIFPVYHMKTPSISFYKNPESKEYIKDHERYIKKLASLQIDQDGKHIWLSWNGGIVRKVDYDGNLSPLYAGSVTNNGKVYEPFKLGNFLSFIKKVTTKNIILRVNRNLYSMEIDDMNKMDAKIDDFIGIELKNHQKENEIEIIKSDKDLEEESERIYNVFKFGDFNKDEDIITCLKSIDVSNISAKAHYIALLFKDKNGDTYEEREFFKKAIKVEGAPDLMEIIAKDALKYGYKFKYGSNNEDHAYFNLFYYLVSSDKKYAQLGFEFLEEADLDHDVDNFPDMIDAIQSNMTDKEFRKMLDANEHVKSYYEYFGY